MALVRKLKAKTMTQTGCWESFLARLRPINVATAMNKKTDVWHIRLRHCRRSVKINVVR